MDALIELSHKLLVKHGIKRSNFIAHSDVAPERKIDPGIFFDWELCANNGLGIWHDLAAPNFSKVLYKFGDSGDEIKTLQQSLGKLGYAIDISSIMDKQTNFVIRSFKSKFYPKPLRKKGVESYFNDESRYNWCSFSKKILHKLLQDT
jgi:N-acetyl-anhydromuramyl-L-alanine amidase AmpD